MFIYDIQQSKFKLPLQTKLRTVGIKNAAEVACIGQTSNKIWKSEKNHADANMLAVQRCNGRN